MHVDDVARDVCEENEESPELPESLREAKNRMSLVARLGSHNAVKVTSSSSTLNQAREKFLERQKEYIMKLSEKRKSEQEEEEQEEKRNSQLREKLRDKVKITEKGCEVLFDGE